jgi:hypothetical protein
MMNLFGIFKKKKPQVKVTPVPRKYTGTNAAVGKALEPRLRKDWQQLKGDIDATSRRYNARVLPNRFKKKLDIMKSRAV